MKDLNISGLILKNVKKIVQHFYSFLTSILFQLFLYSRTRFQAMTHKALMWLIAGCAFGFRLKNCIKKSLVSRVFTSLDTGNVESNVVTILSEKTEESISTFSWTKQWYPIAVESVTDKTKPNEIQLLGNNLVLWFNNKENEWVVFSDVCPHRGVPLSQGRVEKNGELLCAYHAWTFDGSGKCTNIPQTNGGEERKLAMLKNVKSCAIVYPTQVLQGMIWTWGEGGKAGSDVALEAALKKPLLIEELNDVKYKDRINKYTINFKDLNYGFFLFIFNTSMI
jgi:nitrite reductase/ring-hydroxylating ferredoxin subunit